MAQTMIQLIFNQTAVEAEIEALKAKVERMENIGEPVTDEFLKSEAERIVAENLTFL